MTATRLAGIVVCALVAVACGEDAVETATSPETVTFSTAHFSNVIGPGGRRFYSFTLDTSGPVTVTLASVTRAETGAPLTIPLRVGVGRPQGTECPPASVVTVPAALHSQFTHLAGEGIYCVDVADPGTVTGPVRFAVRFTHP